MILEKRRERKEWTPRLTTDAKTSSTNSTTTTTTEQILSFPGSDVRFLSLILSRSKIFDSTFLPSLQMSTEKLKNMNNLEMLLLFVKKGFSFAPSLSVCLHKKRTHRVSDHEGQRNDTNKEKRRADGRRERDTRDRSKK